ncbi:MAG: tetratricopeptide repeat protein [Arenimonas sp.]
MAQIKPLIFCIALSLWATQAQAQSESLDSQARTRMSQGDSRGALSLMLQHVEAMPNDDAARLDLVRYLTWAGKYARAEKILLVSPALAATEEGRELHANLLAWGGRWQSANEINATLLQTDPENFMANFNQAIILRQTAKPGLALPYVDKVNAMSPGSKDAHDLTRGTKVRTDSFIAFDWQQFDDSIDIESSQPRLLGSFVLNDEWRLTAEVGRNEIQTPLFSPFGPISGGRSVHENRVLVGARFAPTEQLEFNFALGQSHIPNDSTELWRVGVDYHASDSWSWMANADHDRVMISPRSASLEITRDAFELRTRFTPNMNWTGNASIRFDNYSDGNDRDELNLSVSRAVVRNSGFMLDLGAAWQHMHYDFDPGNGYYAPDNYRRYSITASSYIGLTEDVGVLVQGGLGRQRDENFTSWRSANDISAELVVGIFSPWELRVRTAYSERVQNVGSYDGNSWGFTLTRRF